MNRLQMFRRLFFDLPILFAVFSATDASAGPVNIQFVRVGDPSNVADPATGYGAVNYVYNMDKYDVTAGQYAAFLNAVATVSDPFGLYNSNMATGFAACGIIQGGSAGNYSYSVLAANQNFPVNYVSWGDAARFTNWLQNNEPSGPEGAGTTETGTYTLNGFNFAGVTRSATATYFIPNENEWYKAAYYAGGGTNAPYWLYATQSNTPPINTLPDPGNHANFFDTSGTGNGGYTDPTNYLTSVGSFVNSPGAYGTYDMGGDVAQWNETSDGSARIYRGGSFFHNSFNLQSGLRQSVDPNFESNGLIGFRVASLPEPSSVALAVLGVSVMLFWVCRQTLQLNTRLWSSRKQMSNRRLIVYRHMQIATRDAHVAGSRSVRAGNGI